MRLLEVLIIAVGLATDAFAVALGAGASGYLREKRAVFRIAFHFGLFQAIMPVIGWLLAQSVQRYLASVDHWFAFGLLCFVGCKMILAARGVHENSFQKDPSRGFSLMALSMATSMDALAVGLSLAFLGTDIWWPSMVIGIVTATLSLLGVLFGKRLGMLVGKRMEIAGGIILVTIGVQILLAHLTC